MGAEMFLTPYGPNGGSDRQPESRVVVMRFLETSCEHCGISLKMPLDKSNRGAQHHRTCGLTADKLRGIIQNDILSALDDCVELGMTAEQMREVVKTIIAKTLQA